MTTDWKMDETMKSRNRPNTCDNLLYDQNGILK